ncbi:MAG: DMT family transporter [Bacilli bacterium]|nr:DMT family transporter [Bacilli bacterium]
MWLLYVGLYVVFAIGYNQFYKVVLKTTKGDGALTALIQIVGGLTALFFSVFFEYKFPTDWKIYLLLGIACVFYALSDRINTSVRSGIEASTFSIIKQLSTVFMIIAGLLFFKEKFVLKKIIGAILIIFSNILIFYQRGNQKLDKYVFLGICSSIISSIALFLDVNNSNNFNFAFYAAITLLMPALIIICGERIKISNIKGKINKSNWKPILLTGVFCGLTLVSQLRAYQLGEATSVAPLCALTVIGNVIVGYIFLGERNNLLKKIIAACLIILSVILIKG